MDHRHSLSRIRYVVGVAAGKGGVGKSTLALHLALSFQRMGWNVGLLDADLYGPSLRQMLPEDQLPREHPEVKGKISPALCRGIPLISMAYFVKDGDCASVRAPIANGLIKQFIHDVAWGDLDCLFVDFPPGTGDIQLTLMQEARLSGGVVITTPQKVALLDVVKAVSMFGQMQIPLLGLVENMSFFLDPATGSRSFPFGSGGGKEFASDNGIYFLGEIPIDSAIAHCCDQGLSLWDYAPESAAARELDQIRDRLVQQLSAFEILETEDAKHFDISW